VRRVQAAIQQLEAQNKRVSLCAIEQQVTCVGLIEHTKKVTIKMKCGLKTMESLMRRFIAGWCVPINGCQAQTRT
jgi:hypothetical protein